MSIELKTASGGSVTLVPEDGVSNVTATVKHESGVLASEFDAGVGRTWQDVTASRSAGVVYTNTTGRNIDLAVRFLVPVDNSGRVRINGLDNNIYQNRGTQTNFGSVYAVVTPDDTYEISVAGSATISYVRELR